jgi:hypothetical protein
MASYFRQVPNFRYVSRNPGEKNISQYTTVKNLFKRGKLRDDIFENLAFFEKYQIIGDERPDQVADKFYDDSTLDWVVLLSNNILNIQSEWPLPQRSFEKYLLTKYGDYENLYNVRHYETIEVKSLNGNVIIPSGLIVPEDYTVEYYEGDSIDRLTLDYFDTQNSIRSYILGEEIKGLNSGALAEVVEYKEGNSLTFKLLNGIEFYPGDDIIGETSGTRSVVIQVDPKLKIFKDITTEITNFDYESRIENEKRNIYILKPRYLGIVLEDMQEIMTYKRGGTQYVNPTLKRGDNIRLYE